MERIFPTRRSRSFLPILRWVEGISSRMGMSSSFLYGMVTVSTSVYMIHPRTSLTQAQPPSLVKIFFTPAKYFSPPSTDRKIHSRAHTVPEILGAGNLVPLALLI